MPTTLLAMLQDKYPGQSPQQSPLDNATAGPRTDVAGTVQSRSLCSASGISLACVAWVGNE